MALHLISAYAVAKSPVIAKWVEGDAVLLAKDGVIREAARLRCKISLADIEESLREQGPDGMVELSRTRKLVLEPSGRISVQPGMLRLRHVNI